MQTEIVTLGVLIAFNLITSLIGIIAYRSEKREILASIDDKIQSAIDGVADALSEIFEKPVVKASMTNLGKMGGAAMQSKAVVNKMAMDVLDGPKFAGLKMAAKMGLNIDIDEYIEEHGAVQTLQAAQSLSQMVGIDLTQALAGGLDGANLSIGHEANGKGLYL